MGNVENSVEVEIKDKVDSFVKERFLLDDDSFELDDEESLFDRGIIDSTGLLELVAYIEETFELKVADEDLVPDNLDSLRKIKEYVKRKKGHAGQ